MKICITGGSGILGTALRSLPGTKVFVDRVDSSPLLAGEHYVRADIGDADALRHAMEGTDVLIHCAGSMGRQDRWDLSRSEILEDNILGLINAFDVAKACGVERIIFPSSNHVIGMYEVEASPAIYHFGHNFKFNESVTPRPDSFYGVSKCFGEIYGRFLSENGGPKCYAIRLGSVRSEDEDHPYAYAEWGVRKGRWKRGSPEYALQEGRLKALWMSRRDFASLTQRLLDYDGPAFDVFNAASDNDRSWLDIGHAKQTLNFQPKDNSEGWVQIMTGWGKDGADINIETEAPPLRLAALIPVRVQQGDNLDLILELLQATIRSARECPLTERVYLSSNDASLVAAAESLGANAAFLRDDDLSSSEVRADTALQNMLVRLETELNYIPDLVSPMEITYPFRPERLLSRLVQKLVSERLNTVIAGYPEHRPVWMRRDANLVRLDAYEQHRNQREPLHVGLASLGCVTYAEILRKGSRFGSHVGVLEIQDPLAVIEICDLVDPAAYHRLRRAFQPSSSAGESA